MLYSHLFTPVIALQCATIRLLLLDVGKGFLLNLLLKIYVRNKPGIK